MKKYILIILIGVISSSTVLKKEINIYEDEQIIDKYREYLEDINKEDYTPIFRSNELLFQKPNLNNSIINQTNAILLKNTSPKNIMKNIDFSNYRLNKIYKKKLSKELESKIDKSLMNYREKSEIKNIFIENLKDKEEVLKFKEKIVEYAKEKIKIIGRLDNSSFIINKNKNRVYNSIIEIDLE